MNDPRNPLQATTVLNTNLPPQLIHELRSRSYLQLGRMASDPSKRGFGRMLRHRIPSLIAKEKTLVEKAITASYLCSYLTDHLILAHDEASKLLDDRPLTHTEKRQLWEDSYPDVVRSIIRDLPDGSAVIQTMGYLKSYTRLPNSLHNFRGRHWNYFRRILTPRPSLDQLEIFLEARTDCVLASKRDAYGKARQICLTASLLSDIESWNRGIPWMGAYSRVMIDLYPLISRDIRIFEAILYLK